MEASEYRWPGLNENEAGTCAWNSGSSAKIISQKKIIN